jgi:hypothetical protein
MILGGGAGGRRDPGGVAATIRANGAAGYELATGDPVMAIGGFNGTDPAPTLAQFHRWRRWTRFSWYQQGPLRDHPVGSAELRRHYSRRRYGL